MDKSIVLKYDVDGNDFSLAGEASSSVKKVLLSLGFDPEIIRKVSIALYEGEMNMVIHANGGVITVEISPEEIHMLLEDTGPGIEDIELAMQEGYSTASDKVRELGFGAGMGLSNMKKYSDVFIITSEVNKGTRVEMVVKNKQ
ncbi:MAG: anti-sigma regulatory factor [Clostridiaceae bacterium]|nr:anti-sigma regulatory factor [Clostridiaceae bacterium]